MHAIHFVMIKVSTQKESARVWVSECMYVDCWNDGALSDAKNFRTLCFVFHKTSCEMS